MEKLAQAMAEHWSARRYAKEARIGLDLAISLLKDATNKQKQALAKAQANQSNKLVEVARKTQSAELALIPRYQALIERLTREIESGQDISAKELKDLMSTRATAYKLMESVTGLDVAKAVAVRAAAPQKGEMLAWDGVEALDASPVFQLEPADEPATEPEKSATVEPEDLLDQEFTTDPLAGLW